MSDEEDIQKLAESLRGHAKTPTDKLSIQVADSILKRGLGRTPVYLMAILELAIRMDELEEEVAALKAGGHRPDTA